VIISNIKERRNVAAELTLGADKVNSNPGNNRVDRKRIDEVRLASRDPRHFRQSDKMSKMFIVVLMGGDFLAVRGAAHSVS
jgi:hypothetical protein